MSSADSSTLPPPVAPDTSNLDAAFNAATPNEQEIDISFFSFRTRKSTLLVGNKSPDNYVRARRNWLDYDFRDVMYVTSICIYATGYENYHGMELSYVPYLNDSNEKRVNTNFSDDHFSFPVNDFIKGFGLRPNEPLFRSAQILRIEVFGVERQHVTEFIRFVDEIEKQKDAAKSELSAYFAEAKDAHEEFISREKALEKIGVTIDERSAELDNLEKSLADSQLHYKKAIEDIEVSAAVAKEQAVRADILQQSIDKLTDQRRVLTQSIVESERQLSDIKENINLFPTDLNGYVRQGTRNVRLYAALCSLPLIVILVVTLRLFSNSERLLDTISYLQGISILEYLLSRLPYVTVSLTVLGICYGVVRFMIGEIVDINRKRQELYKISIIAQDVSYASQDDLELSIEEKYNLRTQTKMELLKEHLRQNLGDEFSYSPRKAFLEHFRRLPKKKIDIQTDSEES